MLVAQVDKDVLINTVMLRTATGISECLPSAVQSVLCKHRELSVGHLCLRVCRARAKGRHVGAPAQLAQLADFRCFGGCLWLLVWGCLTIRDTKYSFLVLVSPSGAHPTLFPQPPSQLSRVGSRKGSQNTLESSCSASVALARTRTRIFLRPCTHARKTTPSASQNRIHG